jgi:ribosomal protein L16 Arg81 hydroxylase
MKSDYVIVDTISVFKQRYIIPREEVQRFNEEVALTDKLAKLWSQESVESEEVKEFSQRWLGETVTNIDFADTPKVLALFKEDNEQLSEEWSQAKQLDYINDWKDKTPKR